jgi:hypothetical protein
VLKISFREILFGVSATVAFVGCTSADVESANDSIAAMTDGKADSVSTAALPSNVVPLTIDPSSPGQDIPAISVTVCVPGTKTCQTIPHIEVDTASTGLRIYAAEH